VTRAFPATSAARLKIAALHARRKREASLFKNTGKVSPKHLR
jgi:hypothetical protein